MFKLNFLEKIVDKLNLKFDFSGERRRVKNKNKLKNSVVGNIQQADRINNDIRNFIGSEDNISDLEIEILRKLYAKYKERQYPRLDLMTLNKELGISDG